MGRECERPSRKCQTGGPIAAPRKGRERAAFGLLAWSGEPVYTGKYSITYHLERSPPVNTVIPRLPTAERQSEIVAATLRLGTAYERAALAFWEGLADDGGPA